MPPSPLPSSQTKVLLQDVEHVPLVFLSTPILMNTTLVSSSRVIFQRHSISIEALSPPPVIFQEDHHT
jgi:hypothetical protein